MTAVQPARRAGAWPFLAWAVTGAALCLALFSILSIGLFVFPVAAGAVVFLAIWRRSRGAAAAGLLSGAGVIPICIAYLNRGGPGTVCTALRGGQQCTDEWSPWPFLAIGAVLVVAGALAFWRLRRTTR
jgi:hypothetical protein